MSIKVKSSLARPAIPEGGKAAHDSQGATISRGTRFQVGLLRIVYRPIVRRAAREALEGRAIHPRQLEKGRWLHKDVSEFLDHVWDEVGRLIPIAKLDEVPTIGNRHNVFLAIVTTAAYRCLLQTGTGRKYAMQLVADVGWKVYARMLALAVLPFRWVDDSQRRLNSTLRSLLRFPFSAPGRPGYEVEAWEDREGFHTHWTYCPPQAFVRELIQQKDSGELEAFYRSWCLYDWAAADLLVNDGRRGHYKRPHTLSRGGAICDMCWVARTGTGGVVPPPGRSGRKNEPEENSHNRRIR